jgi:hypothetical protein
MNENDCTFVSSRGFLKSCDIHSGTPISSIRQLINYDFLKLQDGSILYICSSAIPHFVNVFQHINKKVILVSGDCDESFPVDVFRNENEFINFLNNDKIIHWFSQNCIRTNHPKLTQLPIGLDYHTMANINGNHDWGVQTSPKNQEYLLIKLKEKSKFFWDRKYECYSNFHFSMNTKFKNDRIDALNNIPKELVYYEPNKVKRLNSWIKQLEYVFVISPHGNGLDCHRTWEALCLGCIPIVKTSPLDKLFSELPILIVKEWKDVNKKLLEKTVIDFKNKHLNNEFNYDKLTLKYWMDIIKSYKNN